MVFLDDWENDLFVSVVSLGGARTNTTVSIRRVMEFAQILTS